LHAVKNIRNLNWPKYQLYSDSSGTRKKSLAIRA
jgi:hypothetical protein